MYYDEDKVELIPDKETGGLIVLYDGNVIGEADSEDGVHYLLIDYAVGRAEFWNDLRHNR